ncbi:MAG: hypothetical protein EZS28_026589, partial [Streblomastix strix]
MINQNIYFYDDEHKVYYLGDIIKYVDEEQDEQDETNESDIDVGLRQMGVQTVDILIVQEEIDGKLAQHAFAVANKEALTGLKFCPFCKSKGFDTKCPHFLRDYEKHTKKCEQNGGKIVKTVQLDQIAKPFCPHITQNKTYQYLLAHGRQKEFKPTQYYITYDLETVEKIVNKQFGKSSKQISELVPLSVASTIKNKQGIHTIYSDLRNGDDFITQWLKQVFEEAVIIQQDNQYFTPTGTIDKNMQYNVEVPVIGFNSSKFDFSLIFRNLQCADWEIKNYIGSSGIAKQIVVQHKHLDVKLKFIDVLTYYVPITLKEFAQTFNSEINGQKGVRHNWWLVQRDAQGQYCRERFYKEILKLGEDVYAVQMNPETCACKTPLQVAYFVLDNAKYWYLNFIYNFMYKCFDMDKLHFVEGDTDSAYWAVSGDEDAGIKQQFKHVIKNQQFYDENAKYFFPTIEGDLLDEKKILGLAVEREGPEIIAPAPKNYYMKVDDKEKIKLKGVNQSTNKITKDQIVDNITNGTITKCTNMRLDETMALNLNSKNISLTNITYGEAMLFLPEFDEIKYSTKE